MIGKNFDTKHNEVRVEEWEESGEDPESSTVELSAKKVERGVDIKKK